MSAPDHPMDVSDLTSAEVQRLVKELMEEKEELRLRYEDLRRTESERLKMEVRTQHSQKLESLGVLAGGIAHDFNNQLMGVLGNIEMAIDESPPGSLASEYLTDATLSARAMAKLTHQMLAYSGKGTYVVKPLDLSRLVREIRRLLETSVGQGVVLSYDLPELPPIDGDADQLRQVILNIVTNASEAIGKGGGTVTLTTGYLEASQDYLAETVVAAESPVPGEYVFLEVTDSGSGMSAETRQRIFDPFFSTKFTGRGLGLAVTLGIVRGHRGVLHVESKLGKGACFRALFPQSNKDVVAQKDSAAPEKAWRGEGTVLVADDEGPVLRVAQRMLEKSGFKVLGASNGREALECFHAHAEELVAVILDLTMPEVGGERAFAEMNKVRPDLPIFLASGYDERALAKRDFGKEGPAGFIQKPFRRKVLVENLRSVLEK